METDQWLDFAPECQQACIDSHDVLDSLIAALTTRTAQLGMTHEPETDDQRTLSAIEGWIHVPEPGTLALLGGSESAVSAGSCSGAATSCSGSRPRLRPRPDQSRPNSAPHTWWRPRCPEDLCLRLGRDDLEGLPAPAAANGAWNYSVLLAAVRARLHPCRRRSVGLGAVPQSLGDRGLDAPAGAVEPEHPRGLADHPVLVDRSGGFAEALQGEIDLLGSDLIDAASGALVGAVGCSHRRDRASGHSEKVPAPLEDALSGGLADGTQASVHHPVAASGDAGGLREAADRVADGDRRLDVDQRLQATYKARAERGVVELDRARQGRQLTALVGRHPGERLGGLHAGDVMHLDGVALPFRGRLGHRCGAPATGGLALADRCLDIGPEPRELGRAIANPVARPDPGDSPAEVLEDLLAQAIAVAGGRGGVVGRPVALDAQRELARGRGVHDAEIDAEAAHPDLRDRLVAEGAYGVGDGLLEG